MPPPFHVMVEAVHTATKDIQKSKEAISKYEIMWPSVPNTDFKFNITQEM